MSEKFTREESFKALVGLISMRPHVYTAEIVQKLNNEQERQAGLNEVLFQACSWKDVIAAAIALKAGADLNAKDNEDRTPGHEAAYFGRLECLKLLIAHGADVNSKTERGYTPAHLAASSGRLDCLRLLIAHGSDVNARNDSGYTPSHEAASYGQLDCLKLLLAHGAVGDARSKHGKTPRDLAEGSLEHHIVDFLDQWSAALPQG